MLAAKSIAYRADVGLRRSRPDRDADAGAGDTASTTCGMSAIVQLR